MFQLCVCFFFLIFLENFLQICFHSCELDSGMVRYGDTGQ